MNFQRRICACSIAALAICGLGACTVVKGAPDSTIASVQLLHNWKVQAASKVRDPRYQEVRNSVNNWIECKVIEVREKGQTVTAQVEEIGPPQSLQGPVKEFLGVQIQGIVDDLRALFEWIRDGVKKSREEEANRTVQSMNNEKWPPLQNGAVENANTTSPCQ